MNGPTQAELEKELPQPPKESTKPLEAGLIALLIGAVTGLVLWIRGFFSDDPKT